MYAADDGSIQTVLIHLALHGKSDDDTVILHDGVRECECQCVGAYHGALRWDWAHGCHGVVAYDGDGVGAKTAVAVRQKIPHDPGGQH